MAIDGIATADENAESKDGWLVIGIDEFHHAMEATDSYKANFGRLRARVIEPAIKELQDKDGWNIDWGVIKTGRKVSSLKFNFTHHSPVKSLLTE